MVFAVPKAPPPKKNKIEMMAQKQAALVQVKPLVKLDGPMMVQRTLLKRWPLSVLRQKYEWLTKNSDP